MNSHDICLCDAKVFFLFNMQFFMNKELHIVTMNK